MTTMSNHKFSVLIATRERCDTLRWSLETCVTQGYENLEILVSDNFSQDDTKAVVQSFSDPRIRYVNTGRRLSMSHSFEFALSHATGDYATFLGDDDGLLPNAIEDVAKLASNSRPDAIAWQKARYYWPTYIADGYRDSLHISLIPGWVTCQTKAAISRLLNFAPSKQHLPYEELPGLYNSFVRMDVVNRIKKLSSGNQFFHSLNPDMYSAIAVSLLIDSFIFHYRPLSIGGTSGHSNGASYLIKGEQGHAAKKFLSEENIPFHPKLKFCPSIPVMIAEAFLQAQENLRVDATSNYQINWDRLMTVAMLQLADTSDTQRKTILDTLGQISETFDTQVKPVAKTTQTDHPLTSAKPLYGLNPVGKVLVLDGKKLGINNIYDACKKCGQILDSIDQRSVLTDTKDTLAFFKHVLQNRGLSWPIRKIRTKLIGR